MILTQRPRLWHPSRGAMIYRPSLLDVMMADHKIRYDNLRMADKRGSFALVDPRDIPPGGGGGGNGDPPPPPIDPGPGGRPFGMYALPAGGSDYWNSSWQSLTSGSAASILNTARANQQKLMVNVAANESDWGNPYNYQAWKAKVDSLSGIATIDSAIADGTIHTVLLYDEPRHRTRYGAGGISDSELVNSAALVQGYWPGVRIAIRIDQPDSSWNIPGVTHLWMQYRFPQGDVTSRLNNAVSVCQGLNKRLNVGLNVIDFRGNFGDNIWITPAEFRQYGAVLANAPPSIVDAFFSWKFTSSWYNSSDSSGTMKEAQLYVRNIFRGLDP